MDTIFELVNSGAIASYYTGTASSKTPYLGETLFPAKKKLGLDLSWIVGNDGLPVALKPSHFDIKATVRDRIGVSKVETEMPFFRESMLIKEKDRQELLRIQESSNAELYQDFLERIFNDRAVLIEGARVQAERMRMQLLSTGKIAIVANGVNLEYNYDTDGSFASNNILELQGTSKWTDSEHATPYTDIKTMQDNIFNRTGSKPTRLVMSSKVFGLLTKAKEIIKLLRPNGNGAILTSEVLAFFQAELGITIFVYEKKFKNEAGTAMNFYPEDRVSFLPSSTLGSTWYGTTPEEADLIAKTGADVTIVDTGIAVTTITQEHPVNVDTIVSAIVLPSFEQINEVGIIKVL
nr:MAG TPA: capsid protein [Caudoviricetes sp.]